MGHYADRFPGKTKGEGQTFYLNTGDASSFARKYLFDLPSILNAMDFIMSSEIVFLYKSFKCPSSEWKNTQMPYSANLGGRTEFAA